MAEATVNSADKGPFTSTEIKTIKISGPIEITLTTKYDSSHVPPPPEARRAGDSASIMDALQPLAEMILAKLNEIRDAQQDPN
jgi:hypothetical protein